MKGLPRVAVVASTSHALATLARAMVSLATIWYLSGLSHRPNLLVELYILLELPYLLLLIPSGRWADRRNRYPLVLSLSALRVGVIVGFALWTHYGSTVVSIMVFLLVGESITAILQPARSAWITEMVPLSQRGNLTAINQGDLAIAGILGPALGGILYAEGRLSSVVEMAAVLMILSVGLIIWIGRSREPQPRVVRPYSDPTPPQSGLQFLRDHPGMLMIVGFFALTNALNNVEAVLVPLLAHQLLHLVAWEFGALGLASGGGAVAGSWLAPRFFRGRSLRSAFVSMGIFGGSIVGLGLSYNMEMLSGFYMALGLSFSFTEVITSTLWQVMVPDAVRGQVMGTLSTVARAANPLGYILAGALDVWLGIRGGLVTGGLAIIVLSTTIIGSRTISQLDLTSKSVKEGAKVHSS